MDARAPAGEARPRLAVVYGHRSLDLMQICGGARGWCDLVWLVNAADPAVARARPILRRFGPVVDALGEPPRQAAAALRRHSPDGLATFYDTGMEHVAEIAAELDLPFPPPEAGRRLEDKLHQREALREAGLPSPAAVALPEGADREAIERIGASLGFPAVLKPRRASGSWHTFPVSDARALGDLWAGLPLGEPEAMLLEEYLPDGPPMPRGFEADYVSVETVVEADRMTHLAITGRFPLAPPLRETGFFIPASVAPERTPEILDLATRSLQAVGLRVGAAHTEIKLTPDGPRVIEVNGRIGGGVPDMLRLAAGLDIVKLSMRAALGLPTGVRAVPAETQGVAYRFFYQPAVTARRLVSIDGLDRLKALPGVESVLVHHPPGAELDPAHGTRTYLFAVVGRADDYDGVVAIDEFLRTQIVTAYE
jgi:biotin carboxylase